MSKRSTVRVRLTGAAVLCLALMVVSAMATNSVPFVETFEDAPAGMASTPGALHGQHGWVAAPEANASVQSSVVYSGSKAGSVTNAIIRQAITNTASTNVVWTDFAALPAFQNFGAPVTNASALWYVNTSGKIVVYDGTNTLALTGGPTLETNTWVRFTSRADYVAQTWDLYCDGVGVTSGLSFYDTNNSFYSEFFVKSGEMSTYVDSITMADEDVSGPPMFIDSDSDDLPDGWELSYLPSLTNMSAVTDSDGDGFTDLQEWVAGTDPTNTVSYLRVIGGDLASPASDDVVFSVEGNSPNVLAVYACDVSTRTFSMRAADIHPSNAVTVAASALPGTSQTNIVTITDINAVAEAGRRFYTLVVSIDGRAVTNVQEWAMYVQPRVAGQKYAISVPVDFGASNSLNSTLGDHLARGLSTNGTSIINYRMTNLVWKTYYLTNSGGQAVWYDDDIPGVATSSITAPMGFWLERGSGPYFGRTNAVFVGPSFTSSPSLQVATNYAASGWTWTLFGWPYSTPRAHNSGTASNALGFAAGGYGGTSALIQAPHELMGDQIWIWSNNRFTGYYWLKPNGRWWDNRTANYANFSLQSGEAYFYRHHVATNGATTGTNFLWQPPE